VCALRAGATQRLLAVYTQASPLTFGQKSAPYRNSVAGVTLDTGLPFRIPFEMVNHRCSEWRPRPIPPPAGAISEWIAARRR
jgi:hypothetical protein